MGLILTLSIWLVGYALLGGYYVIELLCHLSFDGFLVSLSYDSLICVCVEYTVLCGT